MKYTLVLLIGLSCLLSCNPKHTELTPHQRLKANVLMVLKLAANDSASIHLDSVQVWDTVTVHKLYEREMRYAQIELPIQTTTIIKNHELADAPRFTKHEIDSVISAIHQWRNAAGPGDKLLGYTFTAKFRGKNRFNATIKQSVGGRSDSAGNIIDIGNDPRQTLWEIPTHKQPTTK